MLLSDIFGNLSQLFWLFAQLPQIWTNHKNKSVEGLSLPFLLNWLSGDITNLIGCLLTNQLVFQRNLAIYFNLIDLILIAQFAIYSSRPFSSSSSGHQYSPISDTHAQRSNSLQTGGHTNSKLGSDLSSHNDPDHHTSKAPNPLHDIPHANSSSNRQPWNENSSSNGCRNRPRLSTRIIIKLVLFLAIFSFIAYQISTHHSSFSFEPYTSPASQTPVHPSNLTTNSGPIINRNSTNHETSLLTNKTMNEIDDHQSSTLKQKIGRLSAWLCAFLYLTSRIPQIIKNYQRKSVQGLSILLFILAFLGNLTYVLSILTSPQITHTDHHNDKNKLDYLNEAIPYLIGSAGTLIFDLTIFIQSRLYDRPRFPSSTTTIISSPNLETNTRLSDNDNDDEDDGLSVSITCSNILNPSPPLPPSQLKSSSSYLRPDPVNRTRSSTSLA
ncbi:hypothetical protein PSTG_01513 [Puccinia striiformis f. sp. tritici PST-78]|uniref:Uncharacterized protein n=1 Tax=Puccinia striiformis f. sp. tritici PST-78 TaxID=1165861 RepID=A0A0L0W1B1_9BASI|nr:hypothetical protein PSTG_01513 [Puccinia striiformis f. sp. tritici PST-78]